MGGDPELDVKWGLCPPHLKLRERNLIALVEIDTDKSTTPEVGEMTTPDTVQRTGAVAYIGRKVYNEVFDGMPPVTGVAFVAPDVIAVLQRLKALWGGEFMH